MRFRSQTWLLLCLLLLAGFVLWWMGGQPVVKNSTKPAAPASATAATSAAAAVAAPPVSPAAKSIEEIRAASHKARPAVTNMPDRLAYRLANTTKTVNQLARSGQAILLENALIDTSAGGALDIPAHLRVQGDPGAYIVQSRGPLDNAFRAQLAAAGATIISYIPENAYLVRVSAAGAAQLGALPQSQTVVAYEPYFKINAALLPFAVRQTPLPEGAALRLLLFADDGAATRKKIESLGAEIAGEDRSPFGPVVTVRAPVDALVALAGLSGVQRVELFREPKPANDLSRVTMGVTLTPLTNEAPYLNLTGSDVTVAVVDTGVDATHPDLAPRVTGDVAGSLVDVRGHGTHVAGIIAGSGGQSSTVTNASGSVAGADFRGQAPQAKLFAMNFPPNKFSRRDSYVQETVYRTNVFIANNSWTQPGENGYDLTAASYDAAVRDALPTVTGSQPLVYVFSVGNAGAALDANGQGGQANSVESPSTAKNVISVGALEQSRNITNRMTNVVISGTSLITNISQPFLTGSDSKTEVADYSGRGNVGVGVEGDLGRFKPDVVAPGSYVVSTASKDWDQIAAYDPTNSYFIPYQDFAVGPTGFVADVIFIPQNTVSLRLQIVPNISSTLPLPSMPIVADPGIIPVTIRGSNDVTLTFAFPGEVAQDWFFGVKNPTTNTVRFDIFVTLVTTNDNGTYFTVLSNLNQSLGGAGPNGRPYYRYESGTSMAAPAVSGVLALMQQFFEQYTPGKTRPSPAMMKALLINGARSASELYDFQTRAPINYQGWGAVQLRSSLPGALSNFASHAAAPMQIYDQGTNDSLVTGQSRTRNITLAPAAANAPLRVTLVWTDPPGNPAAGIKLVNDLDLIVTNRDTGEIYYGNDIVSGRDFNSPADTNSAPNTDFVNNVENVYLQQPLTGTNFSVTVVGRRVNVNAVTAHPNDVAQDYALVISSGSGEIPGAILPPTDLGKVSLADGRLVTAIISNGVPLLDQRVGANTPLLGTTNGITNQWHFYVYTNNTTFTNVAFGTFLSPTLALPREGVFLAGNEFNATRPEADLDLYVSSNPALTNLDPAVIGNCVLNFPNSGNNSSRERGGTESIVFSNATQNQVYYIGVKSEDFEGAVYGFLGVSSELPFDETDAEGNRILRGVTVPSVIPDGSPQHPDAAVVVCFSTSLGAVRRVIVTNSVSHELYGDLFGNLSHDGRFAVLNNHTGVGGLTNVTLVYDDSGQDDIPNSRPSDGPGNLRDFAGEKSGGLWLFSMVDNAPGATGRVENFTLKLEPQSTNEVSNLTGDVNISACIQPGKLFPAAVFVPPGATNLGIVIQADQPVQVFIRRDEAPDLINTNLNDLNYTYVNVPNPQVININRFSNPPLNAGLYHIVVFNPSQTSVACFHLRTFKDVGGVSPIQFTSVGDEPLFDDMVNYSSIIVTNQERIVTTEVGLRIDHPRVSDLAITLVSPRETRVLLVENRGGLTTNGFGTTSVTTNVVPQSSGGTTNEDVNLIPTTAAFGTLIVDYDFQAVPDRIRVEYNGQTILPALLTNFAGTLNLPFGSGIPGGTLKIIVNEGGTNFPTIWNYTATVIEGFNSYFTFTEYPSKTTTPIKFVPPPFTALGTAISTNCVTNYTGLLFSGFESPHFANPLNGRALTGFVDGWQIDSGDVDILTNGLGWIAPGTADTGGQALDINGFNPGAIHTNFATVPGANYILSFAWTKNPGAGVTPAQARVRLVGITDQLLFANQNNSTTNLLWSHMTIPFTATGSSTRLEFVSTNTPGPNGVFIDSVTVAQAQVVCPTIYASYALPEETLDKLKGELADGEWKLELWDNRVGAPAPAGGLKSWQISFVFENTPLPPPPPPLLPPIPPQFVDEGESLCVTNTTTRLDFTNGPGYRLINNPATNGNCVPPYLGTACISSDGVVCWTPSECQGPSNYTFIVLFTTNNVPVATNTYTVTVREVNVAPVLPFQSNRVVSALSQMVVTNAATDVDCPSNSLTYVLVSPPSGAAINPATGVITWTPGPQHVGGTFTFTTIVTDLNTNNPVNSPQLSDTNIFLVTVKTGVTVLGGPGDWSGVSIRYYNDAVYFCGNSTAVGGLAGSFALPLFPAATPAWLTNWPVADVRDSFFGVTTTSNGVYVAGPGYNRTVDTVAGKEVKGLVVKFPFTGPTGVGPNGETWFRQTPAAPGVFPFGGIEGLNATLAVNEGGVNYIYTTGNAQHDAANGGRLYLAKLAEDSTVLWTAHDSANVAGEPFSSGRALATLNGNIYAAGALDGQPYLRRYDATGALAWSRTRPISGVYNGVAAISNYLYTVGSVGTGTNTDFLVEKWDENGNLIYSRNYDHFALSQDALNGVVGVVRRVFCVGYTRGATAGGADGALLEIDPGTGTLLSTVLLGEALDDIINAVDTDVTDYLYMIGESRSYSGTGSNQVILVQYPMPPVALFSIGSITLTNSVVELQWVAPTYEIFQVQWSSNLTFWNAFTNVIFSLNGTYNFTDDGSQTGGLGPYRFYRLLLLP